MTQNIAKWLENLGLGPYADAFSKNDIDFRSLPRLTEQDLKDLGVSLGHRRIFQEAISKLQPRPMDTAEESHASTVPETLSSKAERRQLTVMFCDLVGSTALSEALDPEDYRDVLATYQGTASGVIESYDGFIARYMGDGLLVYFGYPQAHEDDPERAVRAGRELVESIRGLEPHPGVKLKVRIGISTGLVIAGDIVGQGASEERAVLGETPNLAARLQTLAPENTVVISERTVRLVEGRFDLESMGLQNLKGISRPTIAYQVLGIRTASRFDVHAVGGTSPLVGRAEFGLLKQRWDQAKAGEGQVVFLSGEPGFGKSRTAREAHLRAKADLAHVSLTYDCSPFHTNSAFHPLIEQLHRATMIVSDDDPETKVDKLEGVLEQSGVDLATVTPLFASLLSINSTRHAPPTGTPQKQKADFIAAFVDQLEGLTHHTGPVEVLFEDAHWMDPSTLEVLGALIERIGTLPVLMVVTHRPSFRPTYAYGHVSHVSLNRLGRLDVRRLAESLTSTNPLPRSVLDQIVSKSDGIPLFVEELTKTTLESGVVQGSNGGLAVDNPLPPLAIPDTLRDSLMARLDHLAPVKEVAQVGSCIGRQFPFRLLSIVTEMGENQLADALTELVNSELVQRRGEPPDAVYTFKHALVQDAAYESLLKSRRQIVHSRVANALTGDASMQVEPELLAHHLTEAGRDYEAAEKWLIAGHRAAERAAGPEAEAHLQRGLAIVSDLPDNPRHKELALRYYVAAGPVLMMTKGAPAPEVEEAYNNARQLSEDLGDNDALFKSIFGQWHMHNMRGELLRSIDLASDAHDFAKDQGDDGYQLQAHHASWTSQLYRGHFNECLDHADRGWGIYDTERHSDHRVIYGAHDPGACSRLHGGIAAWFLGYPDRAVSYVERAIELSKQLEHPFSLSLSLMYAALIRTFRREVNLVPGLSEAGIKLCTDFGFPAWLPLLMQTREWAKAQSIDDNDPLTAMYGQATATGIPSIFVPLNFVLLADACVARGDFELGLQAVGDGLEKMDVVEQRWLKAEFHRLRAILWSLEDQALVDRQIEELNCSLECARQQQARSLELRTSTTLARVMANQGQPKMARDLLTPVVDWFTEGAEAPDLKAACSLLASLS